MGPIMATSKAIDITELLHIVLKRDNSAPLHKQLYQLIREEILSGRLTAGARLPAARALAKDLKVSRNTVQHGLQQLQAEGYVDSRQGSGYYITASIPDDYILTKKAKTSTPKQASTNQSKLSSVSTSITESVRPYHIDTNLFALGIPELSIFPQAIWIKLWHKHLRPNPSKLLKENNTLGYLPLRQAISDYLRISRAANCTPDRIMITNGAQQALDLICRVKLNRLDTAIVEEPGYLGIRSILQTVESSILTCPVDDQGMKVDYLKNFNKQNPKLIYTTPAHQYPLGSIMPISRRLQLLEWAAQQGVCIIEDDYDGEFHYHDSPLPSLQGLDQNQSVIYVSSFSKVLLPNLRTGYLIIPDALISAFTKAKEIISGDSEPVKQAVLADFITEGHFGRHLKRMRLLYSERMQHIVNEANNQLEPWFNVNAHAPGMQLPLTLKQRLNDKKLARLLKEKGLGCQPLSNYSLTSPKACGLLLGFANANKENITRGIEIIKQAMMRRLSVFS